MSVDTSIIICNYNNGRFLGRAIRSCLKQSIGEKRIEVIVVDDASTDNSLEVIASFKDKIIPILLKKNVGIAEASNLGIESALGRFIMRVDADDYINENMILFMSEILSCNFDIGYVYGDMQKVDENETKLERVNLETVDLVKRHGAGIMFRKSYLETIGLYDRLFKNAEDYELLTRYMKQFAGYHLRLPMYRYSQHPRSITRNQKARKRWELKAKKKHEKHKNRR